MGGTIFSQIEDFGPVLRHSADIKSSNEQQYIANLKTAGFWVDFNDSHSQLASPFKEFIFLLNLKQNDIFLVSGIISHFYEERLKELNKILISMEEKEDAYNEQIL